MARKVSVESIEKEMAKLQEKINALNEKLEPLKTEYEKLDAKRKELKDQELLQYLADNGITLEQIKDQMAKKEEG